VGDYVNNMTPHAKMVKIGAGPARQRGEMWSSNAGYFITF